MDISVASNFERLLFEIYNRNGVQLKEIFDNFPKEPIDFSDFTSDVWSEVKKFFQSSTCNDKEIVETIVQSFQEKEILFDPHTATAIKGNTDLQYDPSELVTFATAHPAKFPDAIKKELNIPEDMTPESLKAIMTKKESYSILENNFSDIEDFIKEKVN